MNFPRLQTLILVLGSLACSDLALSADTVASKSPAAPGAEQPGNIAISHDLRGLVVAFSPDLLEDLRSERWESAWEGWKSMPETERQRPDVAFVGAWSAVECGRAAEVTGMLDRVSRASLAPRAHIDVLRAALLVESGRDVEAAEALSSVPAQSPLYARAALQRAEILRKLSRTREASELLEQMVQRPDPAAGNAEALLLLAQRAGVGSEEAYGLLRRVWYAYPQTPESRAGWPALKAYGRAPTPAEISLRAEGLMRMGAWDTALAESEQAVGKLPADSLGACRLAYVRGRSHYKRNRLSASVAAFGDLEAACGNVEADYGPKALYLAGRAEFRRGRYGKSEALMASIPRLFEWSSYADDGLTHAGIAAWEAGELERARGHWQANLDRFPEGDTVPESTFRLAWTYYEDGEPSRAREVAIRLGQMPLGMSPRHVTAGKYWAARWLAYPDVDSPTTVSTDSQALASAKQEWRALVQTLPHTYYALLASNRLRALEPEQASVLDERFGRRADMQRPWQVPTEILEDASFVGGVGLMRLGLVSLGLEQWRGVEVDLTPDAMAWMTELRIAAGDWLRAHDAMRRYLESHPPGTLGDSEPEILRVAYPDRYWTEVAAAAEGDRYDPRLFHALVREESNFNRRITSFAGARGLSQLMPPTAKQVAGWLGQPVGDLEDPANNTTIGGRYLDALHKQLGSPFLSLAAYNAGARRVEEWLGRRGNVPTDEYVERIPFRETRGYVKRVSDTWVLMRYQFDEGPAFADLQQLNDRARPE